MWLSYCLTGTVISGLIAIAMKKCSKNNPLTMLIQGSIFYHIIMLIICLLTNLNCINMINISDMLYMVPGTVFQLLGFYFAIVSIKFGQVSITAPIRKARVVVVFLLGVIILNESCTLLQLIISAILVTLSVFLVWEKDTKKTNKKLARKAVLYAYGFALFNGISGFLNKIYVTNFNDGLYVLFNYAILSITMLIIYCLLTKKAQYLNFKNVIDKKYLLLYALLDASSGVFNRLALETGNVSVISVIETSSIVVTVVASRIILKEKLTLKKYIIIVAMFICVLLLVLIKT